MIYLPIPIDGIKKFENIPAAYYYCEWVTATKEIINCSEEDSPTVPPTYPSFPISRDAFAMLVTDGYEAFLNEIELRGLIMPIE